MPSLTLQIYRQCNRKKKERRNKRLCRVETTAMAVGSAVSSDTYVTKDMEL